MSQSVVFVDLRVLMEGEPAPRGPLQNATKVGAHELMDYLVLTHDRVCLVSPLFHDVAWQIRVGTWLDLQRFPRRLPMLPLLERFDAFVSELAVKPEALLNVLHATKSA